MGAPAARVGDPTSHGKPLGPGPGSPDVLIAGKPAWLAGADFHSCPLSTGTVPHVGGNIAAGSMTVLVNGMALCRQGDQIIESGPPNAVAAGEPTVLIG